MSGLLSYGSVGFISLRFRKAYAVQGRLLSDLPYIQPLFPLLPICTCVLAVTMFAAAGYSLMLEKPLEAKVRFFLLVHLDNMLSRLSNDH
jgi:amino acid permease